MPETLQDQPPPSPSLTDYDRAHLAVYLRLLDAEAAGADWREVAALVFGIDPQINLDRARHIHDAHLTRARWVRDGGYVDLLKR